MLNMFRELEKESPAARNPTNLLNISQKLLLLFVGFVQICKISDPKGALLSTFIMGVLSNYTLPLKIET